MVKHGDYSSSSESTDDNLPQKCPFIHTHTAAKTLLKKKKKQKLWLCNHHTNKQKTVKISESCL